MQILRRSFLRGAAILAAGGTLTVARRARGAEPFGPLVEDPEGILDLPEGFSYTILQRQNDEMSDGIRVPGDPDGMACFEGERGTWVLMRNHELERGFSPVPDLAFDVSAAGGVSRLVIDKGSLEVVSSNLVLTGTMSNCAGGPSPWGWLSCEESDAPEHGYVFLCDISASETQMPNRVLGYGRFEHEAVAIDPEGNVAYLTEDDRESAFYRFVPDDPEQPFVGTLQAMVVKDSPFFDTGSDLTVGDSFEVEWVDVPDPEGTSERVADQAFALGAARVVRGEGCWYDGGRVYFTATEGGNDREGQVFCLEPTRQGGTLTLIAQAEGRGDLINPDNVTVAPWGDLIVCEDNNGPNHLRGITPDGELYDFARNAVNDGVSEFCGVCFSPNGKVMFVNIQEEGFTLAITGPFRKGGGGGCG